MENKTLKQDIKNVDGELTIVKLIESEIVKNLKYESRGIQSIEKSYTIEIKQGLFITELQYSYNKQKACKMFELLIDNLLEIYVDKFSDVQLSCSLCDTKDTMLYKIDDGTNLCENCASDHGIE